jgi:hypothetical protein
LEGTCPTYITRMKKLLFAWPILATIAATAQCEPGFVALSMNIYTDGYGYETYWELVPGTNACGDGTIAWGSNIETVGCGGAGEQNAGWSATAYPSNTVVPIDNICLQLGQSYTLYFVDDWGDGGLYFEMFQDGNLVGLYQGTGTGNAWTFEAGFNPLGLHDSPCNALQVTPEIGHAVDLSNVNCYTQINEVTPFLVHCQADGAWCNDPAQHTVWAQFTVPDSGSYQISTAHYGTSINTQVAVWYAPDCSDLSSFVLLSSNDDLWGDANLPDCNANPPACVNPSSAAFLNVIQTYPECCTNGWDEQCQALYDALNGSCIEEVECAYTLRGFDSYGDGWNDCIVSVNINGTSTNYTFLSGNYQEWQIPFADGDQIALSFIAAGWPEEVSIQLISPYNQILFEGPLLNLGNDFFTTTGSCAAPLIANTQASRCYVHCLPAGTTCYVQIDGYNNETGPFVLTVEPYLESPSLLTQSTHLVCPVSIGVPSPAYIVTHVEGWGLNHSANWTGPNAYSNTDFHIAELHPGTYHVIFEDACQQSVEATVEILGPQAFEINSMTSPSCPNNSNGSIEAQVSGGTAPYSLAWQLPDGTIPSDIDLDQLAPGQYMLMVIDAQDCSIMAPIVVEPLSQPEVDLGPDLNVCEDFAIALDGPIDFTNYQWSTGANSASVVLLNDDFPEGVYAIGLTVTDSFGCTASDELQLVVEDCSLINDTERSFTIYPNPANSHIRVDGECLAYRLLNAYGQVVAEKTGPEKNTVIDVQNFSTGLYHLHLQTDSSTVIIPILIQH